MITPVDGIRDLVASVQSQNARPQAADRFVEGKAQQIEIRDFDVLPMVPFLQRETLRLERLNKRLVIHARRL